MKDGQIVQKAAPRAIYDLPNCKFVADFVGTTNFIDGRVRDCHDEDGNVLIESALGTIAVANAVSCRPGDAAVISVRPENVMVHETLDGVSARNVYTGTVAAKVFLGETLDFQIRVGEQIVLARVHPSHKTPVGETIHFSIDPGSCIALSSQKD